MEDEATSAPVIASRSMDLDQGVMSLAARKSIMVVTARGGGTFSRGNVRLPWMICQQFLAFCGNLGTLEGWFAGGSPNLQLVEHQRSNA